MEDRPPGSPGARALPPGIERRAGVRGALLHSLPGRAIVVGLVVKLLVWLAGLALGAVPAFLAVVDTVAGLAVSVGLSYFLYQLLALAKRRLLWRVRRKLILSYIFIGFVPALLIVAFFLLCGFLLFYNFSSYLVQSRLRAAGERARFLAESTAFEIQRDGGRDVAGILARRRAEVVAQYPDVSVALVPGVRSCVGAASRPGPSFGAPAPVNAGPWAHMDPPRAIPAWVPCDGFAGMLAYTHHVSPEIEDAHLLLRAVAFPESPTPGYAVVVDVLINDAAKRQLRTETGVDLVGVTVLSSRQEKEAQPLAGREGVAEPAVPAASGLFSSLPSLMEYRDWSSGAVGTLTVTTALNVSELYDRISAAEGKVGRTFGQGLLLVLFVIGALFLIIEFIALVAGLALAKSLTGSVHELFAGTERVRQGDFTHKIAVTTNDQLGELAGSFNLMTASVEDLLQQAAEKKRLEEELRIAHDIQMSLLPQGPLLMPGLTVTAVCVPAREVGGDYYDFLPLDDHRVGVLIADVSGKGTSAALYMAELKGLVLSLCEIHSSPRDLLIAANRLIAPHLDARSFITMTYAVVDVRARTMSYARAGHTPLIYVPGGRGGAGSGTMRILVPEGMVVGLKLDHGEMFERLLREETIRLNRGDLCVFFTDGVSEAMNGADELFGEERLGALVQEHAHLPSDELRERVLREIAAFVGDAPQHDDMTMILLKVDDAGDAGA